MGALAVVVLLGRIDSASLDNSLSAVAFATAFQVMCPSYIFYPPIQDIEFLQLWWDYALYV